MSAIYSKLQTRFKRIEDLLDADGKVELDGILWVLAGEIANSVPMTPPSMLPEQVLAHHETLKKILDEIESKSRD